MAGVADDKGVFHVQLPAQGVTPPGVEAVSLHIDAVEDQLSPTVIGALTEEPDAGPDAAGHKLCGAGEDQPPHRQLVEPCCDAAAVLQGRVGVGDPDGDPGAPGGRHGDAAVEHIVGVDGTVAVPAHQPAKLPPEGGIAPGGGIQMEDPTAPVQELLLVFPDPVAEYDIMVFKFLTDIVQGDVPGDLFRTADLQSGGDDEDLGLVHGCTSLSGLF